MVEAGVAATASGSGECGGVGVWKTGKGRGECVVRVYVFVCVNSTLERSTVCHTVMWA
jgi:hypothetical protein